MIFIWCKYLYYNSLCKCRFCISLVCKCIFCIIVKCKCIFCNRLHYVYDYVYVYVYVYDYVYDLKRERDTRTADEPPVPQLFTFFGNGIFQNSPLSERRKKTLIFFILTLDNSAGLIYI